MSDKAFKQFEEELDMEPNQEQPEPPRELREPVKVDFNGHEEDIKNDYKKVRTGIIDNLECAQSVIEKIQTAIEDSDADNDKFLARKAEVFAALLRVTSDLRKDLFTLHKNKKELMSEEEDVDDAEKKSSGNFTSNNIKDFIIKNGNGFNMKIEDE